MRALRSPVRTLLLIALSGLCACADDESQGGGGSGGSSTASASGGGGEGEGAGGEAALGGAGGSGGSPDKAASCADTFGDELTDSYGRVDGTLLAVVGPTDVQCPLVNDDHLVIQVTMNGAAYRMVVNVDGVFYAEHDGPLVGPPWAEGWHTDVTLEYASTLDVHANDFAQTTLDGLVETVTAELEIGAPISVYAVSSGGRFASSTHLIHSNNNGPDGAILLDPTGANPRYLLFRFGNQEF